MVARTASVQPAVPLIAPAKDKQVTFISSIGSANTILQSSAPAQPESSLAYLTSDYLSLSSQAIHEAILKLFANNPAMQGDFANEYAAVMALPDNKDISPENGQNNAMYDLIMKHRDDFPVEGFTFTTKLPGGASMTTEIPPAASEGAGQDRASALSILASHSSRSAAMSKIVSAVVLTKSKAGADRDNATQDQIAELYP